MGAFVIVLSAIVLSVVSAILLAKRRVVLAIARIARRDKRAPEKRARGTRED
jgi:hypothetical protein